VDRGIRPALHALLFLVVAGPAFLAQEYKPNLPPEHPAIQYGRAPATDPAARLAARLETGALKLAPHRDAAGYLPEILSQLQVNADSQMLVFSKTSFQAATISPRNPRAIYFSDAVTVGFVPGGPTLEVAAVAPVQGPLFYELSVDGAGSPTVTRSTRCLRCHQGPNTAGVPGVYVGSVIPGPTGAPLAGESAIITDHRSDFKDRWGGWYVSAKRGEQPDRANAVAPDPADPGTLARESRQNLVSLAGLFDPAGYLVPTSDIVALMTFEHQTQMTNLITRVGWQARIAQAAGANPVATAALDSDVEALVAYMVFAGEAPLPEPVEGVSSFTRTFPQAGPRDPRGRSLRDFDLHTRLFRYPLSYMVYSDAFEGLPDAARQRVYRRLHDVLTGKDRSPEYAHLSAADRRTILEILRDTKPNLPESWRVH
jgi:hypothetical protein